MKTNTGTGALDGWRVAYDARDGTNRAIVFIHGWSGDRSHWYRQLEGVDTSRRLIAVDLIGHGESDAPTVEYTMDLFARSIAAVLDDLLVERAVLVGHSNGVPVARQFYRRFPERTEGLVAVDGALKRMPLERLQRMAAPLRRPDYLDVLAGLADQMTAIAPNLGREDRERIKSATLATPQHVLVGSSDALLDETIWQEDEIGVPLLFLALKSPYSQLWTEEYLGFVRRIAPRAACRVWDDVSHFVMMERPEEFNALLERFVARIERGKGE